MQKIILIGAGGHCKVVIDAISAARSFKIAAIIDLKKNIGKKVLGFPITADDSAIKDYFKKGIMHCFITVGSIGRPDLRIKVFNLAKRCGFVFPNIAHPQAVVSKFAKLGSGNYIACGAVINADTVIGSNCIINTNSSVDHDCMIGDFTHISPGVTLSAGVSVGNRTHIGAGSCVKQYVKIGPDTIIGAGSTVVKDITGGIVAVGNPCKKIKDNVSG